MRSVLFGSMLANSQRQVWCSIMFGFIGFFPGWAFGYQVITNLPGVPYEVIPIESDFSVAHWYIGTLTQFPIMYEFYLSEPTVILLSLRVPDSVLVSTLRPTLLIVRDKDTKGVEEVARLVFDESSWTVATDELSRLPYAAAPPLSLDLPPGTYRVEVSAPNNEGKYMLVIGQTLSAPDWGQAIAAVRMLYDFYEISPWWMIRSPLVYYPTGIVMLVGLLFLTWWHRRRLVQLFSS